MSLNGLYATAPGEDFSDTFVRGLLDRYEGRDPFDLARVLVLVNTHRTGKRMREVLLAEGARLLPRILPVTELDQRFAVTGLPLPVPSLRRRLQLVQIVLALLDREPDLAPRAAAFDLADSLAGLIDEMHEEGVTPDTLMSQDFGELSAHWDRSVKVLSIVTRFFGPEGEAEPTGPARLSQLIARLAEQWQDDPPQDPVIVAGSTGSRGTTFRLMQAVARLPQGAVVLPGYDFGQPPEVWDTLQNDRAEDHPQYRFARLLDALDRTPQDVRAWCGEAQVSPRSRLISLALRPAPVSDQWIVEGPALGDLTPATEGMSLIEAPTVRDEALAIAAALRTAAEQGQTAAVISADRTLTRLIGAELDRWGLVPDDSAGEPLGQSAQGRFLRHVAEALTTPVRTDTALVLLKHPVTHSAVGRARHLDWTRELELRLRREKRPYPDAEHLLTLAAKDGAGREGWTGWIAETLLRLDRPERRPLADHVRHHVALAEQLSTGPDAPDAEPPVWSGPAGRKAREVMAGLEREADHGGTLTRQEYLDLFEAVVTRAEVRQGQEAHTGIRFRGTIEARVQGADLVILGGLNDGIWPQRPAPDPWMNRKMRMAVGLTLPDRRIGLSAHDFQQAACAPRVILSRSLRDDSAETVPSRWLNRITNLLSGLPDTGAPALAEMQQRGRHWLTLARALDDAGPRLPGAPRPAPRPPVDARPQSLSVTEIQTLIRDPYAIYARHVLNLRPLDPLRPEPDALVAGTLIHGILEDFLKATQEDPALLTAEVLMAEADRRLEAEAHWPGMRQIWRGRIEAFADWFVETERQRQADGQPVTIEARGQMDLPEVAMTLVGKPDRIDLLHDGTALVIDYKTGSVPKAKDIDHFDRQLMLLAMMAEAGVFTEQPLTVSQVAHIGLGRDLKVAAHAHEPGTAAETRDLLTALLRAYKDPNKGFPSRRAKEGQVWDGDYDHLARYGEWAVSDDAAGEDMQ